MDINHKYAIPSLKTYQIDTKESIIDLLERFSNLKEEFKEEAAINIYNECINYNIDIPSNNEIYRFISLKEEVMDKAKIFDCEYFYASDSDIDDKIFDSIEDTMSESINKAISNSNLFKTHTSLNKIDESGNAFFITLYTCKKNEDGTFGFIRIAKLNVRYHNRFTFTYEIVATYNFNKEDVYDDRSNPKDDNKYIEKLLDEEEQVDFFYLGESSEIQRKNLKDSDFGIPELKKFPMPDVKHVLLAIKFFNTYVGTKYEKELADNINKKIQKFKIKDSEIHMTKVNQFIKYYIPYNNLKEDFNIILNEEISNGNKHPLFIILSFTYTPFGNIVRKVNKDCFSHACISLDSSLHNMYSFNADNKTNRRGGFSIEDINDYTRYSDESYIMIKTLFMNDSQYNMIKEYLDYMRNNIKKTSYSAKHIIYTLLNKIDKNTKDTSKICSEFVADILKMLDKNIIDKSSNLVTPEDLSKIRNKRVYDIYEGFVKDYRSEYTNTKTLNISKKAYTIGESLKLINESSNKNKPKKCTKCGSNNIGLFIEGEPIYKCKDCGEYLGTVPFKEDVEILDNKEYFYVTTNKLSKLKSTVDEDLTYPNLKSAIQNSYKLSDFVKQEIEKGNESCSTKCYVYSMKENNKLELIGTIKINISNISNNWRDNIEYEWLDNIKDESYNLLLEETLIKKSDLPKHIYHISDKNHNNKIFKPKTFDNDQSYDKKFVPKHICFSDNIQSCLWAVSNFSKYGYYCYVHVPDNIYKYNFYTTTAQDVYDTELTHEIWSKEPVKMKCIGKIYIEGIYKLSGKKYSFNGKFPGVNGQYLFKNKWKWVEKYYDDESLYEKDKSHFLSLGEDIDLLNESINITFKNPKELSNWMKKNIRYKNYNKLMTADEVYEQKRGSCHDQVMFEKYMFNKMKISHGLIFFIEYNEGENIGGKTHSFLYYNENNKYFWFENAWGGQEGIHGPYNSLSELKKDIKEKDLKNSKFNNIQFSSVKNVHKGMSLNEYVSACLNSNENTNMLNENKSIINNNIKDESATAGVAICPNTVTTLENPYINNCDITEDDVSEIISTKNSKSLQSIKETLNDFFNRDEKKKVLKESINNLDIIDCLKPSISFSNDKKDAEDIYNSFDDNEKKFISSDGLNFNDIIYLNVAKVNNEPVSFLKIIKLNDKDNKSFGHITVGTKYKYRGLGLCELLFNIMNNENINDIDYLRWRTSRKNNISTKVADRLGFKFKEYDLNMDKNIYTRDINTNLLDNEFNLDKSLDNISNKISEKNIIIRNNNLYESAQTNIYEDLGTLSNGFRRIKLTREVFERFSEELKKLKFISDIHIFMDGDTTGELFLNDNDVLEGCLIIEKFLVKNVDINNIISIHPLTDEVLEIAENKYSTECVRVDKNNFNMYKYFEDKGYFILDKNSVTSIYLTKNKNLLDNYGLVINENIEKYLSNTNSEVALDKYGSSTGVYNKFGLWNPIVYYKDKKYRERCEAIIFNEDKQVYMSVNINKFRIPGGGTHKDSLIEEQLINECREEARINIKNIEYVGCYINDFDELHLEMYNKKLEEENVVYDGSINYLFIAKYDSKYTGKIDYLDRDTLIQEGRFYPVLDILKKDIRDEWIVAILYYMSKESAYYLDLFNKISCKTHFLELNRNNNDNLIKLESYMVLNEEASKNKMKAKREKIEKLIYGYFNIIDCTGKNAIKYKEHYSKLSDKEFFKEMSDMANNPKNNFYLEILPNVNEPNLKTIKESADYLGIDLDEYIYYRHDGDEDTPIRSSYKVPVGELQLRRLRVKRFWIVILPKKLLYNFN